MRLSRTIQITHALSISFKETCVVLTQQDTHYLEQTPWRISKLFCQYREMNERPSMSPSRSHLRRHVDFSTVQVDMTTRVFQHI